MLNRVINTDEVRSIEKLNLEDLVELVDRRILYPRTEFSSVRFTEENSDIIEKNFIFSALAFKTILEDYSRKFYLAGLPILVDSLDSVNYYDFVEKILDYSVDGKFLTFLPYISDQHSFLALKIGEKIFILDSTDSFYREMERNDFSMVNNRNFYFIRSITQKDGVNCKTFALFLMENISNTLYEYMERCGGDREIAVSEFDRYLSSFFSINMEKNINLPLVAENGLEILPSEMLVLNQSYKELRSFVGFDCYRIDNFANRQLFEEFERLTRFKQKIDLSRNELEKAIMSKKFNDKKPLNRKRIDYVKKLVQLVNSGEGKEAEVGFIRRSANIDFSNYQ